MKKSLVLAMAMALGVTASAYAANPFSDVPAGHWAYDSVNKLAAAGVVDGYGDGTYGGDKLMTRYEMAQIVAKAMAKGANVDKLAAEFADELDTLGVRVANLEQKADNVKITGQIRASYRDSDGDKHQSRLRSRLYVNGSMNEDWTYVGRLENNQYFDGATGENSDNAGDEDTKFNWAYVIGKVGGVKVEAGRQDFVSSDIIDTTADGVKLAYGKDVKLTGWAMKATSNAGRMGLVDSGDRIYAVDLGSKFGNLDANVRYFNGDTKFDQEIYEVALGLPVAKDLKLSASYFNGDDNRDGDDSGYVVGLNFKGAKAAQAGSWGLYAKYSDRPASTYLSPTIFTAGYTTFDLDGEGVASDGYKGVEVGANYTLAQNIVAGVKYLSLEGREGDYTEDTLWSEVVFTF